MHTVDDVKAKLTEYMMSIDLEKLRFDELSSYADTLEKLARIGKGDYFESLLKMMTPNFGVCSKPESETQESTLTMEVSDNG